jgi:hypothetical protein
MLFLDMIPPPILQRSYWARRSNKKMIVSESVAVSRRKVIEPDKKKVNEKKGLNKVICSVFKNSFGTSETKWTDVIFFGGNAEDTVARLAGSNGKSILYKPTGEILNKIMDPHQKPSINDLQIKWFKRCNEYEKQRVYDVKKTPVLVKHHVVLINGVGHSIEDHSGGQHVHGWAVDAILLIILVVIVGLWRYIKNGKVHNLKLQ